MSRMPVGFSNTFSASSDNLVQSVPANVVGDTNNIFLKNESQRTETVVGEGKRERKNDGKRTGALHHGQLQRSFWLAKPGNSRLAPRRLERVASIN